MNRPEVVAEILCLEDQADVSGIVRDVGIICLLTHCPSGLTRMVATRGGYRSRRRSILAATLRLVPLIPCEGRSPAWHACVRRIPGGCLAT
jgi:hypothetical protein